MVFDKLLLPGEIILIDSSEECTENIMVFFEPYYFDVMKLYESFQNI